MGSKTPPISDLSPGESPEDQSVDRANQPDGSAPSPLLKRIAGALQVPPSALYDLPNAVGVKSRGSIEDDCALLLQAYRRISNPEERRRLLALVQEAVEQT